MTAPLPVEIADLRRAAIADRNDEPGQDCPGECRYGLCRPPGQMCGGCCQCLALCFVAYEAILDAPLVWEGDNA